MSVTSNKRVQLLTEIQNPKHLFIINTGIKTILNLILIRIVVSTHTASRINTIGDRSSYLLLYSIPTAALTWWKSMPLLFFLSETLLSETQRFPGPSEHSFAMLLSWKSKFHFEHFRFMFKWQCFKKTKKNCAALLLLPENIIGVHILNIFLQLSRSCLPAAILLLNVWVFCMVIFNQDINMSRRLLI